MTENLIAIKRKQGVNLSADVLAKALGRIGRYGSELVAATVTTVTAYECRMEIRFLNRTTGVEQKRVMTAKGNNGIVMFTE